MLPAPIHGFLNADAAPITMAITMPRPAPREAPTTAAVIEFPFSGDSCLVITNVSLRRANSTDNLFLANSWRGQAE